MNNNMIEYQPNQSVLRLSKVVISTLIITIILTIFLLMEKRWLELILMIMVDMIYVGYLFYIRSLKQEKAIFDSEGIQLLHSKASNCCYIPWHSMSYMYHYRDNKDREYMFLSSKELNREQLKDLCFKSQWSFLSNRMYIDNVVILFMNPSCEDVSQIRMLVSEQMKHNHS